MEKRKLANMKQNRDKQNMKRKMRIITSASAASILAFAALAQETTNSAPGAAEYSDQTVAHGTRAERPGCGKKASDLIGMEVKNNQNEKLGKVDDLAVDVESGRIVYVILSTGGFIGIGDTLHAVPPGALHHDVASKTLQLDADKEKLNAAPKFEMAKWTECCNSNQVAEVYSQYGQQPYCSSGHKKDASKTVTSRNADGTWGKDRIVGENEASKSWAHLSVVQKASKVIGTPVKNLQDEKLGKVENLMVDLSAGRIVAVVISSGGFIGIGDELSAVPPSALRFNTERDTLQLDASKETLAATPHFKANQWPDFSQPSYASDVYSAYKIEPYFATDATNEVDNTRINVRDRQDQTLTPLNQGNSKADVATTAQIRKEIIAEKTMSVNAQNVKIITIDGQVTLRGPVNTAEEKRLIGEIADRSAHSGNVDNQLEVQPTPVSDK
jgi:sporulation protein YlmC with PRC-barrel domain